MQDLLFKRFYALLIGVILAYCNLATAAPRAYVWGMAGAEELARLDFLVPLYKENFSSLLYTDLQGEADTTGNWYSGLGIGYRGRVEERLLGGYFFVDRNYTAKHHDFYIMNPGFETLGVNWDARINGYYPLSRRSHKESGIPFFRDTCGDNFNCDQSVFQGHQQFLPIFSNTEEVGPGLDAEVGGHFGRNHNFSVYGGGYYHHFKEANDIMGLESRMVVPIRPMLAFTVEASYDNQNHGAIVAGFRIQGGHLSKPPIVIEDHLYDPITRNLGTVKTGLSVPVARTHKFERLLLVRDDIYFFSQEGSGTFVGETSGTFENPLAPDQFTQTTVDGINAATPNANLFFNTGTYIINPTSVDAPNASIVLPGGQSLFGRTADFKCSAIGDERPIFLGEIELLQGFNNLDSIILNNSLTLAALTPFSVLNLVALNIQDATDVSICNSVINADFTFTGATTSALTFVTAINASNSIVDIHSSVVSASAIILNDSTGENSAVAIGGNNVVTENNQFTLSNSIVSAIARVNGSAFNNGAVAIGNSGLFLDSNFINNVFSITSTQILSEATVGTATGANLATGIGVISNNTISDFLDNTFTIANTSITTEATNGLRVLATGIGGDTFSPVIGSAQFINNNFTIVRSDINAYVTTNIEGDILVAGIGGNAVNGGLASFINNNFDIQDTQITVSADHIANNGVTFATGIGGNADIGGAVANFDDNNFSIEATTIDVMATSADGGVNFATVIGGNAASGATADFGTAGVNIFTISNSILNSTALINDNLVINSATGIGGNMFSGGSALFSNTLVEVTTSSLNVLASVLGNNPGTNIATGLIADPGTTIDFSTSVGIVRALVAGTNTGTNTATAFIENGGNVIGGENIVATATP